MNRSANPRAAGMRSTLLLVVALFVCAAGAAGQAVAAGAEVVTVYSENGRYYLKSVQYDTIFPSTRGRTSVYETGRAAPLYVFERGFDGVDEDSNNLTLSDDGEVIFYVIPWGADEQREGMKSVNVYRRGALVRGYTETEINGCDKKKERCTVVYNNYDAVVDRAESRWGTPQYRKAFKAGVDERERFLSDFPVFSRGGTVYLTDSKRRVHLFDLKSDGALVRSDSFDALYEELKGRGRFTRAEVVGYDAPALLKFPRLKDGRDTAEALAAHLGMKSVDVYQRKEMQFKWYSLTVGGYLLRDGGVEVEEIEADEGLPRERVAEFFRVNRFDARSVPRVVEKWHVGELHFVFRKQDAREARREKREELARQREEFAARVTAEKIGDVYVPKDLGESFAELDKLLPEVDRAEMRALPQRGGMIRYHIGLGTWMRNNWGLWGGSRLQKYFNDHGVTHPEEMSALILYHYHDWLNGDTASWKEWEKRWPRR